MKKHWSIISKSLQLYKELGDKNGIARNLGNIGIIYTEQKNYSKALEYYLQALKLSEELGLKIEIATNLGNIGSTYLEMAKDTGTGKHNSWHCKRQKFIQTVLYKYAKEIGDLNTLSANYQATKRNTNVTWR